ncbi:hypothetical protein GGE06_003309 [Streptomyces sp. SFB5A]|uniref:Uncharacterized protein n=1 Tax=Streptomyces nymphaeiformis TaxID=2663842 RepID=A0A7W7XBB7_9ACTN|nr:hypothetical protein [Streptomyces nymphaeiformis]
MFHVKHHPVRESVGTVFHVKHRPFRAPSRLSRALPTTP